jgi:hypothetical protein
MLESNSTYCIQKITLFGNKNDYRSFASFNIMESRHTKKISTLIGLICINFKLFATCIFSSLIIDIDTRAQI